MAYYNQGLSGMGMGMGYNTGSTIPMMGDQPNMVGYQQQVQNLAQSQQSMAIQQKQALLKEQLYQQAIDSGAAEAQAKQMAQQTSNDYDNMVARSYNKQVIPPATQPQQPTQTTQNLPTALSGLSLGPSGGGSSPGGSSPTAPVAPTKAPISTPTNPITNKPVNTSDTSGIVDPNANSDGDFFTSKHTWTTTDPNTGATVSHSFDRQGLYDNLMNYTDAKGNHALASVATKALDTWQTQDAADEKAKNDAKAVQSAQVLGQLSAFSYLTPSQQVLTYNNLKNQAAGNGIDTTSWPPDISSAYGQAWLAKEQNEALQNNQTAKNASKAAEDFANNKLHLAQAGNQSAEATKNTAEAGVQPSITAKNNADAFKAYQEGLKAKQEAAGGVGGAGSLPARTDAIQNYANAITQGRATWPTNRELMDPAKSAGLKLAMTQDSTLNQATFGIRQKAWQNSVNGPDGKALASADTALRHLGNFVQNAPSVPDAGSKPLNNLYQPIREWTSNNASDALGKASVDQVTLSSELESAYRSNGGSEKGIGYFQQMLNPALPLSTKLSNAREMANLVGGKREETVNKLNKPFPPGHGLDLSLSPEAQSALNVINGGKPTTTPTATTPTQAPQAPMIKVGQAAIKSNGQALPDGQYHGFTVSGGKVSSVGQ